MGGTLSANPGWQRRQRLFYARRTRTWRLGRRFSLFPPSCHQTLVAAHAKNALRCAGIAQVLDLPLAVATSETAGAKRLVAGQNGKVLDLVSTRTTTVGAVVADQRAIAEQEKVGVRIEEGLAGIASETVNVPAVTGCEIRSVTYTHIRCMTREGQKTWKWSKRRLTQFKGFPFFENLRVTLSSAIGVHCPAVCFNSHLSTALAWIYNIFLVHRRLGKRGRRF